MSYKVFVDQNAAFMDEEERRALGEFESLEGAIAACRRIVDEFLISSHKPGMSAQELYGIYTLFGEDPWIAGAEEGEGADGGIPFSAWDYAGQRSEEICRG